LQETIKAASERYDFAEIVQALLNFCSVDLGSLYLDVTKDRLYTMQENSLGRRSAQSAMYHIIEAFTRWIMPILAFTAEELWEYLPAPATGVREANVLFSTWYEGLSPLTEDAPLSNTDFEQLLTLREEVAKVLEPMRASGEIGAALDAEITITTDKARAAHWQPLAEELRFLFISGDVHIEIGERETTTISARRSEKPKCIRCWHHRADVGVEPEHPQLCGRCVRNIEGGGETRLFF